MDMFMSRSMFCEECYKRNHPYQGDLFVVYKGNHEIIEVKKTHSQCIRGYSPHLIFYEEPLVIKEGVVELNVCCSVNFCGVFIDIEKYNKSKPGEALPFKFLSSKTIQLPYNEFVALRDSWRGFTGYTLI